MYENSFYTFNVIGLLLVLVGLAIVLLSAYLIYYLKGRILAKAFLDEIEHYKRKKR